MNESKVSQKDTPRQEAKQDTNKSDLIDDVTLPFSIIFEYIRTIEFSSRPACPYVLDVLVKNTEENLKEIANALNAKFGRIQIEHENYNPNRVIYPWGKVAGVVINGKATGGEV
jgi:hypothetical protein